MDQQSSEVSKESTINNSIKAQPSVWEIYYPYLIHGHQDAVYVASFPEIMYFWPTILTLFLAAFLQGVLGVSATALGWLSIVVLAFNFLVLVQDFDQKRFVIFVLCFVTFLLGIWIINLYGFTFLKSIAHWILSFKPQVSTDAYLLFGTLLLLLFIWGLVSPLFSYWKFEQNEFIHFVRPIGKAMSIARVGCTINMEIPDVFEWALGFGAGRLIIRKDTQILGTIPHVPFLSRRMVAIDHMLSETRVFVDKER